jgi:long-chain acyl-CoA synthetase
MVIGDGQKMPAAFIQLDFDFIKEWAVIHGIDIGHSNEAIVSNEKVIARIQEEIDLLNVKFGNWEKIKRFELTPDIWSIEGGQLTPTLKLKRKIVMEKYINLFHKIYN